jgi:hypothetical protein
MLHRVRLEYAYAHPFLEEDALPPNFCQKDLTARQRCIHLARACIRPTLGHVADSARVWGKLPRIADHR